MNYTHHAEHRMQQRGIPELALVLLSQYGQEQPSGNGTSMRYFDKRGWARAEREILDLARNIDRIRDMYFIEGQEEVVVTAGHRTQPVKKDYKPARRADRR